MSEGIIFIELCTWKKSLKPILGRISKRFEDHHLNLLIVDELVPEECDQIGQFLKVLGDMVSIKSSPNKWYFLGLK